MRVLENITLQGKMLKKYLMFVYVIIFEDVTWGPEC